MASCPAAGQGGHEVVDDGVGGGGEAGDDETGRAGVVLAGQTQRGGVQDVRADW